MAIYSPSRETELHCDASSSGFGSGLMQKQYDGVFHPVAYFSERTTDVETRYQSFELETFAIIYSLRRLRAYLKGIKFKILTNCNSLALTLAKRNINSRTARWALVTATVEIEDIDFQLCAAQARDKEINELKDTLEQGTVSGYDMVNGVVYRKINETLRFFVPKDMENEVIRKIH